MCIAWFCAYPAAKEMSGNACHTTPQLRNCLTKPQRAFDVATRLELGTARCNVPSWSVSAVATRKSVKQETCCRVGWRDQSECRETVVRESRCTRSMHVSGENVYSVRRILCVIWCHISRVILRRNWDSWSAEQSYGSCEDRYHTVSVAACSLVDSCMFIRLGQQSRIFTKNIVSDKYRVNSKWKETTSLLWVELKEPLKYLQILNKTHFYVDAYNV